MNSRQHLIALIGAMVIGLGVSQVMAQDWPQWRGARRDGQTAALTIPAAWPEALAKQWTVPVGVGDATPALVGERLYTFGRMDANEVVQCLQAADGSILWHESYPADYVVQGPPARAHSGPRSSVAVMEGKVCTLGVGGILSCLDAATGKVLWRKQSLQDYQGNAYQFDTSMSPLLVQGLCIVHIGGKGKGAIMAFDLKSGSCRWVRDGYAPACSSPVLMNVAGMEQVVTLTEKDLLGVALSDGTVLWQTPFEAQRGNNTTPVIIGDQVILSGLGQGLAAFQIQKQQEGYSITPAWANPSAQISSRFTTPVAQGDVLFGYGTHLFAFDLQTHAVLWQAEGTLGNSAALVEAGDVMVALGAKGDLIIYKPSRASYQPLAQYSVSDKECWAHPIVAGQRFLIRDADSVTLWSLK